MVVGADHSWGSVGGGNLEEAAVRRARELIASGAVEPETQEAQAQRARPEPARPAMLRRRGDAAAGAIAGPAGDRGVRHRSRGLRTGQDPVPAGHRAAPGRLPRGRTRPAPVGRRHRRDRRCRRASRGTRGAGARDAAARRACADHDARPRGGLRALRCGAAPSVTGQHRADRVQRQMDRVPAAAGRAGPRTGGDRSHHQPDRAAGDHRQGARGDRRQRGRLAAAGDAAAGQSPPSGRPAGTCHRDGRRRERHRRHARRGTSLR